MNFSLLILSPNGVIYEGNASVCYVPTSVGPLGILPGHTPIIDRISEKGGVLRFEDEVSKTHYIAVSDGALKVDKDKVMVLATNAVIASSEEQAKELLASFSSLKGEKIEERDVKLAQGLSSKKR